MKYRGDVSIYWSGRTGISRNALARITEMNRERLDIFKGEGLDVHDAGVRLSIVLHVQVLIAIASSGNYDLVARTYGEGFSSAAIDLSKYGQDFLITSYPTLLKGILASVYDRDNVILRQYITTLKDQGSIDKDFSDLLNSSATWVLNDELSNFVLGLPRWAKGFL